MVLRQPGAVLMDAIFVVTSMSIVFFRGHQPAAFIRFVLIICPKVLAHLLINSCSNQGPWQESNPCLVSALYASEFCGLVGEWAPRPSVRLKGASGRMAVCRASTLDENTPQRSSTTAPNDTRA